MFLRVLIFFFCCLEFFQTVSSATCDANTCSRRCQKPTSQPAPGENNLWVPILSGSVGLLILVVIVFGSVLYIRSRRLQEKLLQSKLNRRPQNSLLNEYTGNHSSPAGSVSVKQTFEVPNDYEEINYFELDNPTGAKNNKSYSTEPESGNYYLTPYCVGKPSNPPPSVPLPLDVFKHN